MTRQSPEMSVQEKASLGRPLSAADKIELDRLNTDLDSASDSTQPINQKLLNEAISNLSKRKKDVPAAEGRQGTDSPPVTQAHELDPDVLREIHNTPITELNILLLQKVISEEQFKEELERRPKGNAFTLAGSATGIPVEYRNWSQAEAKDFILNNVPQGQQSGLLKELEEFQKKGPYYSVSIRKDNRGYGLVRFQTTNPWDYVKKDAAQSVTREVRRETGKQINRLINPDYSHNEVIREYRLVREAIPEGTATRQVLEKTDKAVSAVLTASGLTAEAANLLVNAIRGALLESPELKYKVAALIPDDLVRQSYVVGARSMGNTLREYIHRKYHLPDRPKQTPILVNSLAQLKPEQYRAQDAQKVGVDMRDLTRENAREFILTNVPTEKQASALETIDRLPGNTFGVQIMDTGWVRISASAREPRSYDNRPRYGSYDATKKPQ